MTVAEQVAVLGAGSMGTTLAAAAAAAGHPATVWCPDSATAHVIGERLRSSAAARGAPARTSVDMAEAVGAAALVIVAVASKKFRDAARALGSLPLDGKSLVSATKGFEPDNFARMSEILTQETGSFDVGVIAGANITTEIAAGRLTALVVASERPMVRSLAKRCLESRDLRVWTRSDPVSVEVAAALKNVVAIGVGMAVGLELGFNACSIVFGRGLEEIATLGAALGADPRVFAGIAGAGDLFLTASSPDAMNRRLGIQLGRGARLDDIVSQLPEVPEGIGSVRACRALARRHGLSLPISEAVAAILEGERDPESLEIACRDD